MIKVGDVCPLFFNPLRYHYSAEADYTQKFHSSDSIHLQVFSDGEEVSVTLHDLGKETSEAVTLQSVAHNDSVTMYYHTFTGFEDGAYRVTVNGMESEPFCVSSSDELLDETVRISYSNRDNNSAFDNLFWVNDEQQVFHFRIEGGFKPAGVASKVSNEQYRTQFQEIRELYAVPYDSYTLTIGNASGVPYWMIRHINRILCLTSFKVDGVRYVRSESAVPEVSQVLEDMQSFTATLLLEQADNDIAGIGGQPQEATASSVVGFSITDPKDGEMLQYSESENAFVNTDNVVV